MDHITLERYINDGLTAREIATAQGVTQSTITYWLRKHNLSTQWKRGGGAKDGSNRTSRKRGNRAAVQWDWTTIQNRYDEGTTTLRGLCKEFGLNLNIISRARKQGLFKSRTIKEACRLAHLNGSYDYSVYRTPEFRRKTAKNGGYKPRSGRGKGAWLTNIVNQSFYLQSSYEIRMAVLLNKAKVLWERPESTVYHLPDGSEHRYYPDFLLPEFGVYLDTKNKYLIELHAPKLKAIREQTSLNLHIITDSQINGAYLAKIIPAAKDKLEEVQVLFDDWKAFYVPKPKRRYIPKPRKTKMPEASVLAELVWLMPLTHIAAKFGMSDSGVQKWLSKIQITRPPNGYWPRRQAGWTHEEALNGRTKNPRIPRKLTNEQVSLIRQRIEAGEKLLRLAREYQVCHKTMRDIRDRVRYKDVA